MSSSVEKTFFRACSPLSFFHSRAAGVRFRWETVGHEVFNAGRGWVRSHRFYVYFDARCPLQSKIAGWTALSVCFWRARRTRKRSQVWKEGVIVQWKYEISCLRKYINLLSNRKLHKFTIIRIMRSQVVKARDLIYFSDFKCLRCTAFKKVRM